MKNLYNKIKKNWTDRFTAWIGKQFEKIATGSGIFDSLIIKLYQSVKTKREFMRGSYVIHVKKGKRKYDALFMETENGTVRVNLGRHEENLPIIQELN